MTHTRSRRKLKWGLIKIAAQRGAALATIGVSRSPRAHSRTQNQSSNSKSGSELRDARQAAAVRALGRLRGAALDRDRPSSPRKPAGDERGTALDGHFLARRSARGHLSSRAAALSKVAAEAN